MGFFDGFLGRKPNGGRPEPKPGAVHPPRRGLFTQCVCVLLEHASDVTTLRDRLDEFEVVREVPPVQSEGGEWLGGPGLVLEYDAEENGYAVVDVLDAKWPDRMGDPKGPEAPLFAAWGLGQFGPSTYPGALERAMQHAYRWREGAELASRHRAFVRVRTSYVLGADADAPVVPADYDPIEELRFVTDVARALLDVPGALAYFNPNGEILASAALLDEALGRSESGGPLPVDVWANVRLFRSAGSDGRDWSLFDTVGLSQIGVRDHEAALPADSASFDCVPGLLLTIAAADARKGGALRIGDTAEDFAGGFWRARSDGDSVVGPPRDVLRWSLDGASPPPELDGPST